MVCYMENRFGTPASGTPEWSARREFELLLLLGGSRKAAVQLWLRKQRIYANAQQAAGRPATEAKGPREAAERQAGGESKPETAAQAARRHRSERRLREKHLARKVWAAVRVRKHLSRWCERARAAVAKRPASSSTTSTAAAAPPPAPPPPPPAPDQAQARATPPAGAAAAASSADGGGRQVPYPARQGAGCATARCPAQEDQRRFLQTTILMKTTYLRKGNTKV